MDHEITLSIDLLYCDHLGRYTEDSARELIALAEKLECEAKEKQAQAFQLREAAAVLFKAHAVFDISGADAMDMVPDDEMN